MKSFRFNILHILACLSLLAVSSCAVEEEMDYREKDYGYVQFKLYKEASYETTKAIVEELDYLSQVSKVTVTLEYGESRISQTLVVSASSNEAAEYGMRSDKLKLLAGEYRLMKFTLYDKLDQAVYEGVPSEANFAVVEGGLTSHDLLVNVTPRGKVRFSLIKDIVTKAASRAYTFDEISEIDIEIRNTSTGVKTLFEELPAEFSVHFTEDNDEDFGYQTSSSVCDTLLTLKAGVYEVISYTSYDENGKLLENCSNVSANQFEVFDNRITETDVPVKLYEADPYIQDYYALKAIWESLDGENWYYIGENYPSGTNWNFNKDVDMWGDQPGVKLHSNGRVALLDISNFGARGDCSERLGDLTELVELYMGTHNDTHNIYDPLRDRESGMSRMDRHKAYLSQIHPRTQMSEPIARALMENNIMIPEIAMHLQYSEDEIIEKGTGAMKERPELKDMNFGKITHGLTSIPESIGNLKNLEMFYVANCLITKLPESMATLPALTDVEVYNCPELKEFPMVLSKMPNLVSLLISNNRQWTAEKLYEGLDALAQGPSKGLLQMLYVNQNNLAVVPASFRNLVKLGLLDLSSNKIEYFEEALGQSVNLVQCFLDDNLLTTLPKDEEGYFCGIEDVETFSVTRNKFRKFPNIFSAKSIYTMASVDFSYNDIDGFEGAEDGTYNGIKVSTLTLNNNPYLTKYPKCLAETNSVVGYVSLRGCSVDEIPEGSFTYENSPSLMSLDLSYNKLDKFPREMHAGNLPYLYGVDVSYNRFSSFPWEPLDSFYLTVLSVRGQRNANGERCLSEWPTGIYNHTGMRALYMGSNNLGKIDDTISYLIYVLDISDNPNIIFDATDICSAISSGLYTLIYDQTQEIRNCDILFR
ncbi:MAG: DUF4458 domain-containing protein [Bacteroidales bacterium]|nr:DUF4458 domain-containing protein [Bacteroidales bacterium]